MGRWPFLGRDRELRHIHDALTAGPGSGLVIAGPAGVGKTRLAAEAMRRLPASAFATYPVVATQATAALPLGALAALLPAELPDPTATGTVLRVAADALLEQAQGRRVTVFVDDAHVLDDASAALLLQLQQTGRASVLLTVRVGEATPEPVRTLWKDQYVDRMELTALSDADMERVLVAELRGLLSHSTVERLLGVAQGNLLLLRELVTASIEAGVLAQVDGLWQLQGPWPMAPRLVELIEARLGRIDDEQRRVLELLAYGEPLELALLAELTPTDVVQRLEAGGLVRAVSADGGLQMMLAHPLYAEMLRGRCPALRTRQRRRELVAALEQIGSDRPRDVLRLAVWRLDAGLAADPELLLSASRHAWAAYDLPLAERLVRTAVESGGGAAASEMLAQVLVFGSRPTEAEAIYATMPQAPTDEERVSQATARVVNLAWGLDHVEAAMTVLDEVRNSLSDPYWRAELPAVGALVHTRLGHHDQALSLAAATLDAPDDNDRATAQAWLAVGFTKAYLGGFGESLAALEQARQLAKSPPWLTRWIEQTACLTLLLSGDLAGADALVTDLHKASVQASEPAAELGGWCTKPRSVDG